MTRSPQKNKLHNGERKMTSKGRTKPKKSLG